MAAQHDWLLTCANLGDSRAIVDTGREVTVLTDDHRVATHKLERRRLEKKGAIIAPVDISGADRHRLSCRFITENGLFMSPLVYLVVRSSLDSLWNLIRTKFGQIVEVSYVPRTSEDPE